MLVNVCTWGSLLCRLVVGRYCSKLMFEHDFFQLASSMVSVCMHGPFSHKLSLPSVPSEPVGSPFHPCVSVIPRISKSIVAMRSRVERPMNSRVSLLDPSFEVPPPQQPGGLWAAHRGAHSRAGKSSSDFCTNIKSVTRNIVAHNNLSIVFEA